MFADGNRLILQNSGKHFDTRYVSNYEMFAGVLQDQAVSIGKHFVITHVASVVGIDSLLGVGADTTVRLRKDEGIAASDSDEQRPNSDFNGHISPAPSYR